MDGLKRQDRRMAEEADEETVNENEATEDEIKEVVNEVQKERRSFLDKLTERVKDFLDNAE